MASEKKSLSSFPAVYHSHSNNKKTLYSNIVAVMHVNLFFKLIKKKE